jgi:GTP-binding protein
MVAADADDIHQEYRILLNELANYNPELLDKRRVLAISKSDMLDEELMEALSVDLPEIPHIFISSVTGYNITALKDLLWNELNADGEYKKTFESMTHRNLDIRTIEFEDDDDIPEEDYDEEDWDGEDDFDADFYYEDGEEFEEK